MTRDRKNSRYFTIGTLRLAGWAYAGVCMAALVFAAACGQGELDEVESEPGALVRCASTPHDNYFDMEQMTGNLADDPHLAEVTGLDRVDTCDQARQYLDRLNEYQESLFSDDEGHVSVDQPEPQAIDGIEKTESWIKNPDATNSNQVGVVEVNGGCTGVVITSRAILTAAHCVDQLIAPAKNGWANLSIRRYTPSEVAVYSGQVRINIHPSYSGDGDTADDVAVVKLFPPDTFGLSSSYRTRIYTGLGSTINTMRLYGRGVSGSSGGGSSILRFMYFTPDWWGPYHFLEDATGAARVCNGDSGGPTIDWTPTGYRVVAGLHSNSEKTVSSGMCAAWNGKQRSVRLQNKVTWIEDMLDVTCTPFSDSGWSYVRCW